MRARREKRPTGPEPKPVETWAEAHSLLLRLVEAFDRRSLFSEELSKDQAFSKMRDAVLADDVLGEIAERLRAAPDDFLTAYLLSPDEEARMRRVNQVVEERPPGGGASEAGEKALLSEFFAENPHLGAVDSVEEEAKLMLVQEFLAETEDVSQAPTGRPRLGYRLAAAEICVGLLGWAGGLWLEQSARLTGGAISITLVWLAADGCYRWHLTSLRDTATSSRDFLPGMGWLFRLQIAAALVFISYPFNTSLSLPERIWFGVLGAILIWNVLRTFVRPRNRRRP